MNRQLFFKGKEKGAKCPTRDLIFLRGMRMSAENGASLFNFHHYGKEETRDAALYRGSHDHLAEL